MSDVYCFYSGGGTTFMKTREGDAAVVFSTRELAESFLKRTGHPLGEMIPLSGLGDQTHPWKPKTPLPYPSLQILFSSEDDIGAWIADREHFDTAPHISRITDGQPNQPLQPTTGRSDI